MKMLRPRADADRMHFAGPTMPEFRKRPSTESRRTVDINGHEVSYVIKRHPRAKHMRLKVSPFDGVVVTMPLRLPRYLNPDKFVLDNGEWVLNKLRETGYRLSVNDDGQLRAGKQILYRGKRHRIVVERLAVSRPQVVQSDERHTISIYLPRGEEFNVNQVLKAWLRSKASERIKSVTQEEARAIGVRPKRVSVREQKTKWGSCTAEGNISFNWRLILFPPRILRYVVVHELCHLRHFNHSPRFWRLVEQHSPEYLSAVEWLKTEGMNSDNLLIEL